MSKSNKKEIKQPLFIILLLIACLAILYYGSTFLIPIAYGIMFGFLVNPIHEKLLSWGSNKYISAITSTVLIILFFVILLSTLGWQIQELADQSDKIKKELVQTQQKGQKLIKGWFDISFNEQEEYAEKVVTRLQNNIGSFIGNTAGILSNFFLSLIYCILFLAERDRIGRFFIQLFDDKSQAKDTIAETAEVTQNYLVGKLIVIGILAVTYSIGFLIAGIEYAILLGVLSAFLTFIPYAGNLIGGALAILITLATGGSMREVLIIFFIMSAAQVVESYILTPWIIGDNIDLNPLFSIVAVVGFSILWGAAGAIIALPLTGILKVLFSHIKTFEALGYLMGTKEEYP
jgi:predicted PurR-regulated permease PerM